MRLQKLTDTLHRAGTLGRIAATARGVSRSEGEEKAVAQRALASLLADARGIPLKVGQFLASASESEIFDQLATGVEPLPLSDLLPSIEHALGRPLGDAFAEFSPDASAASLGQVHRARLHTGDDVAVKVRYPHIASAVAAELRLAKLIPGLGPVRTWGFDLDAYKRVLHDDLMQELDYGAELRRQEGFGSRMNVGGLVVPRVYPEWSSNTLLVQAWEDGLPLDAIRHWPREDKTHLGLILMCTLFQSLFVHGEIHGDPHAGNYRYRRGAYGKPEVVLMDYGCTIPIPSVARLALLRLILGAIDNDDTAPIRCFTAMGFDAEKLEKVGRGVRDLFGQQSKVSDRVHGKVDDAYVRDMAEAVTGKLGGKVGVSPRIFLKKLVDVMDRVELYEEFNPRTDYPVEVAASELTATEKNAQSAADIDLEMP